MTSDDRFTWGLIIGVLDVLEAWLHGFTLSEFDPAKLLTAAIIDQARKHRKRPPREGAQESRRSDGPVDRSRRNAMLGGHCTCQSRNRSRSSHP